MISHQVHSASLSFDVRDNNDREQDKKAKMEMVMKSIEEGNSQMEQQTRYLQALEQKQREIDKLNAVIEATSPIPGFNVEHYKRLILAKGENDDVDYRDKKIVDLAKKCRSLTVQTNKYSSELESMNHMLEEAMKENERLQQELKLASSLPLRKPVAQDPNKIDVESLQKDLQSANRSVDDFRRKLQQSKDENKALKAALTRELGEGVSVEQSLEGNWRGRAQQIVMLKAKIKRLEAAQSERPASRKDDVDSNADNVISGMEESRKQAIEAITTDYNNIQAQKKELEQKVQSQKARIRNLETDLQTQRTELQVVLDKTKADDELVDLLKQEIQRLKDALSSVIQSKKNQDNKKPDPREENMAITQLKNENMRLERLNRSQNEQLQTQDKIIRELRSQLNGY